MLLLLLPSASGDTRSLAFKVSQHGMNCILIVVELKSKLIECESEIFFRNDYCENPFSTLPWILCILHPKSPLDFCIYHCVKVKRLMR